MHDIIVIFSHGFGVRKHSGGLFTDIADALQKLGAETILFNYNDYDEETKELFALPFSIQAQKLQEIIDTTARKHPDKKIVILGHSQGCIIPCLCDLSSVHALIMLSPSFHNNNDTEKDKEHAIQRYSTNPDNVISFIDYSRIQRTDGSITIIPPAYRQERFAMNFSTLYSNCGIKNIYAICPLQDEIMDPEKYNYIQDISVIHLDGDHNFSTQWRQILIERIGGIIGSQ